MKVLGVTTAEAARERSWPAFKRATGAFYKYEALLNERKLSSLGGQKAFGTACVASTLHGSETLHLTVPILRS